MPKSFEGREDQAGPSRALSGLPFPPGKEGATGVGPDGKDEFCRTRDAHSAHRSLRTMGEKNVASAPKSNLASCKV